MQIAAASQKLATLHCAVSWRMHSSIVTASHAAQDLTPPCWHAAALLVTPCQMQQRLEMLQESLQMD